MYCCQYCNSRREKSRVVLDLYNITKSGDTEAQRFYIQTLQEHLVLLDEQIKDICKKIITLGDSIEEKEKEKDRNEERKALIKSNKRKLKEVIPSFETSERVEVNRVTRETLCVKNNTVELLDSGDEAIDNSSDDDDDILNAITQSSNKAAKKN